MYNQLYDYSDTTLLKITLKKIFKSIYESEAYGALLTKLSKALECLH